jgi:hypothetical protein
MKSPSYYRERADHYLQFAEMTWQEDLEGALCRVAQDYDEIAEDLAAGVEPPDYRPGVSLETAPISACGAAASAPGSDALSISDAICSCWAIVSYGQKLVTA